MADYSNLNAIKKALSELAGESTAPVVQNSVNKIIQELTNYLNRLEAFYNNIENSAQEKYSIYQEAGASETTTNYALYKSLKGYDNEATNLLKEGYILIDEIRTFFTGEKIVYDIGFTYGKKDNLYELEMSLEEVLENVKAVYNTRSKINNLYKLRMNVRKGDLVKKYNEMHDYIETVDDGSSTVYSSIMRYIEQKAPRENKGNVYEAYKVYVAQFPSNRIPPAEWNASNFDDILSEVKSNIAASIKGGDFKNYQIKFISSAPSLMTTATVRTTLQEVLSIFQNISGGRSNQEITNQVTNLFIKNKNLDSVAGRMEEDLRQESEDFVVNRLKEILNPRS